MPLVVRELERDDVAASCDVLNEGFANDPINPALWPAGHPPRDAESREAFLVGELKRFGTQPESHLLGAFDVRAATPHAGDDAGDAKGELIAVARWTLKEERTGAEDGAAQPSGRPPGPPGTNPEVAWAYFGTMADRIRADRIRRGMGEKKYWCKSFSHKQTGICQRPKLQSLMVPAPTDVDVEMLVTSSKHLRRGAAKMLLLWGTERADGDALECYVTATTAGKPAYEWAGFLSRKEYPLDLRKWGINRTVVLTDMVRPPKTL